LGKNNLQCVRRNGQFATKNLLGCTCRNGCGKFKYNATTMECACHCDVPDTPYAIDCFIDDADLVGFKTCPSFCKECDPNSLNCTKCLDGY
jgi:hypothetical protein